MEFNARLGRFQNQAEIDSQRKYNLRVRGDPPKDQRVEEYKHSRLRPRTEQVEYFKMPTPDPFLRILANPEWTPKQKLKRMNFQMIDYSQEFFYTYGDISPSILLEEFLISEASDPPPPAETFGPNKVTYCEKITKSMYAEMNKEYLNTEVMKLLKDLNPEKCDKKYEKLIAHAYQAAHLFHFHAYKLYVGDKAREFELRLNGIGQEIQRLRRQLKVEEDLQNKKPEVGYLQRKKDQVKQYLLKRKLIIVL